MSQGEKCGRCRFWDVYDGDLSKDIGDCRKRAPQISETILARNMPGPMCEWDEMEHAVYAASAFPVTHASSWCGDFEAPGPAVPC